jgi:hypothetical protein
MRIQKLFLKVILFREVGDSVSSVTLHKVLRIETVDGIVSKEEEKGHIRNLRKYLKGKNPGYEVRITIIPVGQYQEEVNQGVIFDKIVDEMKPCKWTA